MFRSGKRRPEKEDSLVPHGMVWYGTPEPPPEPSEEFLESTVHYAQVMEMMRRRAKTPAQQSREQNGSQPEPATGIGGPAPVPWWRVPSPDPDPEGEASALSLPTTAVTPLPKLVFPSKVEALPVPSPTTVASNPPATSEVKNEVKEIKAEVKNAVKKEVKNDVGEGAPARAQARAWMDPEAVINFTRSSLAHSRRLAADGRRLFSRAAAKLIRERATPRWKPPRVRFVLTGLPLRTRILATRQLSEWKMWNPSATPDTRLRSAMLKAAACAVVVLFGVSLASHFASRFLPSHTLRSSSTLGAKSAGPSAPAVAQPSPSAVATGPQSFKNQKSPSTPPAPKSGEEKPSRHSRAAHGKHHHPNDDDFVAPNTYKYYGKSGSR